MLRTWSRQLRKRLLGGTDTSRPARRQPASARPGVEALERRELLSGNTAGYVLNPGGYLYQRTSSGLVLRDTGVKDYTAPCGNLYDLHTDGRVYALYSGGGSSQIFSNASALVSDSAGYMFALNFNDHNVYEYYGGTYWLAQGSNFGSLVSDYTGTVFGLSLADRTIYAHNQGAGNSWSGAWSGISSLAVDANGNAFALFGGSVIEHTAGSIYYWNTVGDHTASLVGDATGNIFTRTYDGNVWEHVLGGGYSWNQVGYTASSLVGDQTGNVFALYSNGNIYEHNQGTGWSWTQVGYTARALVSDATGNVFALYWDGNIWEHNQGTGWSWTQAGYTASSLVSDATGNVFALYWDGNVWEHNQGTGWSWTQVGYPASSLVSDATGNVFALYGNGIIYEHNQGSGWSWTQVGSSASSLVSDATGNLFALTYDGTIYEYVPGSVGGWNTVGGSTQTLLSDATGNVYSLTTDGTLYEHTLGAGYSWGTISYSNVNLLGSAAGTLFALGSGGNLSRDLVGSWQTVARLVNGYTVNANGSYVVTSDWFSQHLSDPGIQGVTRNDFNRDAYLTRNDMLDVFAQAESGSSLTAAQFQDLKTIVASANTLTITADVLSLANKVVNGDPANANYHYLDGSGNVQTVSLGNLHGPYSILGLSFSGSSSTQLCELVNKWFWGINYPASASSYQGVSTSVPLTAGGFNYYDVKQGGLGDCWLEASLAEVAARWGGVLQNMFVYDGTHVVNGSTVGVWTVRFAHNGLPDYVTVDAELPGGGHTYDDITHNNLDGTTSTELWVALAEKAYAVENESGWIGTNGNQGQMSYAALNGGWPSWALPALTGYGTSNISITTTSLANAWNNGQLICLCTSSPSSSMIVGSHCYAVVGYNSSSTTPFTVFNPWGLKGNGNSYSQYDLFSADATFLSQNYTTATECGSMRNAGGGVPGMTAEAMLRYAGGGVPGLTAGSPARPAAAAPARVSRADQAADAAFASGAGRRDDGLLVLAAAVAGRGKHDRHGDALFADGESW